MTTHVFSSVTIKMPPGPIDFEKAEAITMPYLHTTHRVNISVDADPNVHVLLLTPVVGFGVHHVAEQAKKLSESLGWLPVQFELTGLAARDDSPLRSCVVTTTAQHRTLRVLARNS